MRIIFHKNFRKGLKKLTLNQKKRVDKALEMFEINPHNPDLENHPLQGDQRGKRAISAGGNLRLIFIEKNKYELVQFIRVGTHNQVY